MKLFVSTLEPSSNLHLKEVIATLITSSAKNKRQIELIGVFDSSVLDSHKITLKTPESKKDNKAESSEPKSTKAESSQSTKLESKNTKPTSPESKQIESKKIDSSLEDSKSPALLLRPSFSAQDFSVMGFSDVLKKLPFILKAKAALASIAINADKILLMDSSSFNIRLAAQIRALQNKSKQAKKAPIYYYILPQIWAWKKWRAKALEQYCDHLLGILPFELDYYTKSAQNSLKVRYVGHPLLDELHKIPLKNPTKPTEEPTQNLKQNTNIEQSKPSQIYTNTKQSSKDECLIFMPGSRRGEIKRIFPIFYELAKSLPNKRKILVIPKHFSQTKNTQDVLRQKTPSKLDSSANTSSHKVRKTIESKAESKIAQESNLIESNSLESNSLESRLKSIYEYSPHLKGALDSFELCFDSASAFKQADFGFICSGTATLEAALLGIPFVLGYKSAFLDYYIAKSLINLNYIGLANILFNALNGEQAGHGETKMHEELIQKDMSIQNLLYAYHHTNRQRFYENALKLRAYLKHGSAQNVAKLLQAPTKY